MVSLEYTVDLLTDLILTTNRGSLAKKDRVAYTTAVRCLQATPNVFSNSEVPGARSRFDDVIGTHIIQAPYIHFSVSAHHLGIWP